jgi:hypothetical protein
MIYSFEFAVHVLRDKVPGTEKIAIETIKGWTVWTTKSFMIFWAFWI